MNLECCVLYDRIADSGTADRLEAFRKNSQDFANLRNQVFIKIDRDRLIFQAKKFPVAAGGHHSEDP